MVLIVDGNSEHVAYVWKKKGVFLNKFQKYDCSRSKRLPETDQIANFTGAPISELPSNIPRYFPEITSKIWINYSTYTKW